MGRKVIQQKVDHMQAKQATIDFVTGLNARLAEITKDYSYTFDYQAGRSYDRIMLVYSLFGNEKHSRTSGHAFVDRATDGLVKMATYKAPQKNADGSLAIRYRLDTPERMQKAIDAADMSGHYLYNK